MRSLKLSTQTQLHLLGGEGEITKDVLSTLDYPKHMCQSVFDNYELVKIMKVGWGGGGG